MAPRLCTSLPAALQAQKHVQSLRESCDSTELRADIRRTAGWWRRRERCAAALLSCSPAIPLFLLLCLERQSNLHAERSEWLCITAIFTHAN